MKSLNPIPENPTKIPRSQLVQIRDWLVDSQAPLHYVAAANNVLAFIDAVPQALERCGDRINVQDMLIDKLIAFTDLAPGEDVEIDDILATLAGA